MNFRNIVIMMSKFGSKSGDFAQQGKTGSFRENGQFWGKWEVFGKKGRNG